MELSRVETRRLTSKQAMQLDSACTASHLAVRDAVGVVVQVHGTARRK
jgi:hypothetical protein